MSPTQFWSILFFTDFFQKIWKWLLLGCRCWSHENVSVPPSQRVLKKPQKTFWGFCDDWFLSSKSVSPKIIFFVVGFLKKKTISMFFWFFTRCTVKNNLFSPIAKSSPLKPEQKYWLSPPFFWRGCGRLWGWKPNFSRNDPRNMSAFWKFLPQHKWKMNIRISVFFKIHIIPPRNLYQQNLVMRLFPHPHDD